MAAETGIESDIVRRLDQRVSVLAVVVNAPVIVSLVSAGGMHRGSGQPRHVSVATASQARALTDSRPGTRTH